MPNTAYLIQCGNPHVILNSFENVATLELRYLQQTLGYRLNSILELTTAQPNVNSQYTMQCKVCLRYCFNWVFRCRQTDTTTGTHMYCSNCAKYMQCICCDTTLQVCQILPTEYIMALLKKLNSFAECTLKGIR